MAESIVVELDEDDDGLQRAVRVNGRYVDPWGTARMPSKVDVLRWKLLEKNERGIGGTWRELFRFKHEVHRKYKFEFVESSTEVLTPISRTNFPFPWRFEKSRFIHWQYIS